MDAWLKRRDSGPRPGLGWIAAVVAVTVVGVTWRFLYVFDFHPPEANIFSDMKMYVTAALRLNDSAYQPGIADALFPPGTAYLLAVLHGWWGDWMAAAAVFVLLSALVPLLLAVIGCRLYGWRVGLGAMALSSLYFPFVDYTGYFLAETPYTFLLLLALTLMTVALSSARRLVFVAASLGAGLALGAAAGFKSVVLLPGLFLIIYIAWAGWRGRWRPLPAFLSLGLIGMSVVLAPLAERCTRLNEGGFCLISTNGALNVLLGHYGELRQAEFYDDGRAIRHHFGLPVSVLRGYRGVEKFPFGVYENDKVFNKAMEWMRDNPGTALHYSLNHVFDLFLWPHWPTSHQPHKTWATLSMQFYLIFLLPAMMWWLLRSFPTWRRLDARGMPEALLFLPLLGVMAVAFLTAGEPRLRIPYDGFAILLALRGYEEVFSKACVTEVCGTPTGEGA